MPLANKRRLTAIKKAQKLAGFAAGAFYASNRRQPSGLKGNLSAYHALRRPKCLNAPSPDSNNIRSETTS
jgi:hypothetical protein